MQDSRYMMHHKTISDFEFYNVSEYWSNGVSVKHKQNKHIRIPADQNIRFWFLIG